jgi:hypothetical protein
MKRSSTHLVHCFSVASVPDRTQGLRQREVLHPGSIESAAACFHDEVCARPKASGLPVRLRKPWIAVAQIIVASAEDGLPSADVLLFAPLPVLASGEPCRCENWIEGGAHCASVCD